MLQLQLEQKGGFLLAHLTGLVTLPAWDDALRELEGALQTASGDRLVVNLRGLVGWLGEPERRSVGALMAVRLARMKKVALVIEAAKITGVVEREAQGKGLDLRLFDSDGDAVDWALRDPETAMEQAIDLAAKLASFSEHWQPRTVSEYNGNDLMVAKIQGEYHWHVHPDSDDFFLVLKGDIEIDLEGGRTVRLAAGQMFVVPRGVQHRPRAAQEAHILLIEPSGTPNSGDPATAAPRRVI